MDKIQLTSLRTVLDYLEHDEERHWQEEGCPSVHIYNDICELRRYLDKARPHDKD